MSIRVVKSKGDVYIPPPKYNKDYKYPFLEMEVGDYFDVPRPEEERHWPRPEKYRTTQNVASHIVAFTKKYPDRKFVTRQIENGTIVRCWRTE